MDGVDLCYVLDNKLKDVDLPFDFEILINEQTSSLFEVNPFVIFVDELETFVLLHTMLVD